VDVHTEVPEDLEVRRRVTGELVCGGDDGDLGAGPVELAGDDEPVAAVVAAAADDEVRRFG
jgi:hypothetical protein